MEIRDEMVMGLWRADAMREQNRSGCRGDLIMLDASVPFDHKKSRCMLALCRHLQGNNCSMMTLLM